MTKRLAVLMAIVGVVFGMGGMRAANAAPQPKFQCKPCDGCYATYGRHEVFVPVDCIPLGP